VITIITIITITVITMPTIMATITTMSIAVTTTITATPMLIKTNRPADAKQDGLLQADASVNASGSVDIPEQEAAALYRLMTWLSPSFPVGAFAYSSGLEWVVEAGDITDAKSLQGWLSSMLTDGAGLCDAIFLSQCYRAASAGDVMSLAEISELASVFVTSRERHLETTAQGRAFIEIAHTAWNSEPLDKLIESCAAPVVYPVAVGLVCVAHHVPLAPSIHAFLHAVASNWISAAARLVPLGQTDSQRVLAELEPVVAMTARRALAASLDDLGSATFRADLASMRHETQYTRLFRS
jgi:urease accessory protein